jgi:hypothetical protein
VVRTGEAPNLDRKADRMIDQVALTGEVSGGNPSGVVPRLNQRPYGRGRRDFVHDGAGGD